MKNIKIKTLSGFINAIKKIGILLPIAGEDIWYRGISDDSYKLVPGTVWRAIDDTKHRGIIEEWLNDYILYSDIALKDGFDIYALAQHYGLPTRLLDWTTSPLTALYFALEKEEENEKRIVWCMNPHALNKITVKWNGHISISDKTIRAELELDKYLPAPLSTTDGKLKDGPIALRVQPKNRRLSSQKGCFTLHGKSELAINDLLENKSPSNIVKIEINGKSTRENIRRELFLMGITEDSIFQDLNSLSTRLMRNWGVES